MTALNLTINGRTYAVSCPKGQEGSVGALAEEVDALVREIVGSGAASGEVQPLVLAALMLAEEARKSREDAAQLRAQHAATALAQEGPSAAQMAAAKALADIAGQIHSVAGRLRAV
ncbi:MAG: cell division protein ZapA [Alphaproteobacteria bacterium]|jgi:cell division protein ZapA|nr:cell division protein ZapA [Alphaproteobacteria bacterium]